MISKHSGISKNLNLHHFCIGLLFGLFFWRGICVGIWTSVYIFNACVRVCHAILCIMCVCNVYICWITRIIEKGVCVCCVWICIVGIVVVVYIFFDKYICLSSSTWTGLLLMFYFISRDTNRFVFLEISMQSNTIDTSIDQTLFLSSSPMRSSCAAHSFKMVRLLVSCNRPQIKISSKM